MKCKNCNSEMIQSYKIYDNLKIKETGNPQKTYKISSFGLKA
jgi:hypothetical protein